MNAVILESTLTCPACGYAKTQTMPTDACQWFYECEQCHTVLRPKPGDCCVYCSYGTVFNTVAPGTELSGVLRRR